MIKRGFLVVPLLALLAVAISLPSSRAQESQESFPTDVWVIALGHALEDQPLYVDIRSPASLDLVYAEPGRLKTFISEGQLVLQLVYWPRMRIDSYWYVIITEAESIKAEEEGVCPFKFKGANACLIESTSEESPIISMGCVGEDPTGALLRVEGELFVQYIEATDRLLIRPLSAITS